jgi:hypothetical protein
MPYKYSILSSHSDATPPKPTKSGAGYLKNAAKSRAGDLSGRGRLVDNASDPFGSSNYAGNGRVNQRAKSKSKMKNIKKGAK